MWDACQGLIGHSTQIELVNQEIARAAATSAKVMITGETGVGKEVVARLIHTSSARRHRRLVTLNCSGIPETLLESELFGHARGSFTGAYRDKPGLVQVADGGSLFLDELGEMSLRMQASLLRFAETGEVQAIGGNGAAVHSDVRLITATHRDLPQQIEIGAFRRDLYYRLNVVHIHVPPLRERGEDVSLLLRHFLHQAAQQHRCPLPEITSEAERALLNYEWPGNVRELKNVAERLVVRGRATITVAELPTEVTRRNAKSSALSIPVPAPVQTGAVEQPFAANVSTDGGVEELWGRLEGGEDFWNVVHRPFRSHDLTRDDVRRLVSRALAQTRGSYRQVARLFHLPDSDYKRFMAFLSQHDCNVPFRVHRAADRPMSTTSAPPPASAMAS